MQYPQHEHIGHGGHRGWVHSHSATLVELFRIVDAAWILAGLWYATWHFNISWGQTHYLPALLAAGCFTVFTTLWPLYRSWRVTPLRAELNRAGANWLASIASVSLIGSLLEPYLQLSGNLIAAWTVSTLVGLLGTRATIRISLRLLRLRGGNFRTAAIIGANETGRRLEHLIQHTAWMGLKVVGFYDDRSAEESRSAPGLTINGSFADLLALIKRGEIDLVYITLPLRSEERIHGMISQLRDTTVTVYFVPNFTAFGLLWPRWDSLGGMPLVSIIDTPHQGINAWSKRMFDIVVSSLILALIAIPMLALAIAIKLTTKGPVIFRQKRYGLEGKEFEIWKFRTMTVCEDGKAQFTQATKHDTRITPLGAFMRRTSLDELPQFINVLQGRMSIVGPRPHPIALNESQRKLIDGYMLRHKVKPGITGWAQVHGYRGETDTPEKMLGRIQYDLEYINNWSLGLDVRIIAATASKVLQDPNAH